LLIDTEKKGLEQNVPGLARLEDAPKADAVAKEMHKKGLNLVTVYFLKRCKEKFE